MNFRPVSPRRQLRAQPRRPRRPSAAGLQPKPLGIVVLDLREHVDVLVIGRELDADDVTDLDPAKLDGCADLEPVDRLAEERMVPVGLAAEAHGAEHDHHPDHGADGQENEEPQLRVVGFGGHHAPLLRFGLKNSLTLGSWLSRSTCGSPLATIVFASLSRRMARSVI